MRLPALLIITLCVACHAAEPVFTPIGLSINGDFAGQSFEFQPFDYERGVTVDIHLAADGLISLDKDATTITAFADDKGKDLMKSRTGKDLTKFGSFPKINNDGSAALFSVRSSDLPSKGAQSVSVSGTLAIKTATAKDKTITKSVTMTKGTKITWGTKQFAIDEVSKGGKLTLSLKTDHDVSDIIEISLADAAGKKTVFKRRGSSSFGIAGKRSTTIDYEIDASGDAFDVTIEFWKDMTDAKLPFSIKTGLGL